MKKAIFLSLLLILNACSQSGVKLAGDTGVAGSVVNPELAALRGFPTRSECLANQKRLIGVNLKCQRFPESYKAAAVTSAEPQAQQTHSRVVGAEASQAEAIAAAEPAAVHIAIEPATAKPVLAAVEREEASGAAAGMGNSEAFPTRAECLKNQERMLGLNLKCERFPEGNGGRAATAVLRQQKKSEEAAALPPNPEKERCLKDQRSMYGVDLGCQRFDK